MDFKVAGTANGVSALQMDIKIQGITEDIMKTALAQAKQGRMHILGEMAKALTAPRPELSDFAPRLITLKIHPDKIRRSEEHTSELQSLMRISYAVFCLKKKKKKTTTL